MLPSTILHQKPGAQWAFVPHADAEEIAQTLVAFANSEGGTLCLGVGADGRLGTIFTPEEAADALMAAQRLCRPPVPTQWQQEQVPGGAIVLLRIDRGGVPATRRNRSHTGFRCAEARDGAMVGVDTDDAATREEPP